MTSVRTTLATIIVGSGMLLALPERPGNAAPPADASARNETAEPAEKAPEFEIDIAPIFVAKCLKCHGENDRKAELDLRSPASVLKGGESGQVVVANDSEKSLLFEKVIEGEMPPAKK